MSGPHEGALEVLLKSGVGAGTELGKLGVVVVEGVRLALSVHDKLILIVIGTTEWSELLSSSVEVDLVLAGKVGEWAFNVLTSLLWVSVHVVKTVEPVSTGIGGKSPLSNPNLRLEVKSISGHIFVVGTVLIHGVVVLPTEGLVIMMVTGDLVPITILKEIVPEFSAVDEGIVVDEVGVWGVLLNKWSNTPIKVLKSVHWRVPPWLIDWLEGAKGFVAAPSLEHILRVADGPVDVGLVDVTAGLVLSIPIAEPVSGLILPVTKVVLVGPNDVLGLTGVVETILGVLHGVDVKEDLDSILGACIEHPVDLLGGTIGAANVWAVLVEGPVTDWKSDHVDSSLGEVLNILLGIPGVPMGSEEGVAFLGSEDFADGILVKGHLILGLSKESVKEGGGDPWLEDHPSTDVSSGDELFV